MAKNKNQNPGKSANAAKPEQKISENSKIAKGELSLFEFYFRSIIIALGTFLLLWYVIVYNYHDMAEAEKLAIRQKNREVLGPEDNKKLMDAQRFFKSSEYAWFYNYKWVYHNLLNKNLELQFSLDTMDVSERQLYKSRTDYQFLKLIIDSTPSNAVILMPDESDLILPEGAPANTPRFSFLNDKAWCYYFLHPRTLVYDEADSKDSIGGKMNIRKDPDYAKKRKRVTHVAIVYGRGYEHLSYAPESKEAYAILPIKKPESK